MGTVPFVSVTVSARQSGVGTLNLFASSLAEKKRWREMAADFRFSVKRLFCFSLPSRLERKHIAVTSAEQQWCSAG